jgi:hypothetical protein
VNSYERVGQIISVISAVLVIIIALCFIIMGIWTRDCDSFDQHIVNRYYFAVYHQSLLGQRWQLAIQMEYR